MQEIYKTGKGNREDALDYCIIITDGRPTVEQDQTVTQALATRRRGITIIVVAIGIDINEVEIYSLASEPKEKMRYFLGSFAAMQQSADLISKSLCNGM